MVLVGFLVLSFRQILIYFFSFMHQSHMGVITISESTHFGLSKTIFTFPQYFLQLLGQRGKVWKNWVWTLLQTLLGPRSLQKKFLNESKCIYCNRITLLPKQIDMKITSCLAVEPQSSVKISFCSVFKLLLLKPPLWSHVVLFF